MHPTTFASAKLQELLRPQQGGAIVDPHVVAPAPELRPDYEKMQRILAGGDKQQIAHVDALEDQQ